MDTTRVQTRVNDYAKTGRIPTDYKDGVWKVLEIEVRDILNEEIKKAAQELIEEQRKMIKLLLEENKIIIHQVLDEEKRAIQARAGDLRRSILTKAY